MQTRDPEPVQQADHIQSPAREAEDAGTPTRPTVWTGWRGPLLGALLAVTIVFAVIDMSHILFPQRTPNSTRPIIIQVQNGGGDTSTAVTAALAASPPSLDLRCGQGAALTVTNTTSYSVHWNVNQPSNGITLSANSPRGGGLAPGEHATLQVLSLNQSTTAILHFTEDRGSTLDVIVRVRC